MNDSIKKKALRINSAHKGRVSGSDVTTEQMMEILSSTHCYWCNVPLDGLVAHVDHLMPISKGGKHTFSNIALTCQSCNNSKRNKTPEKFRKIINGEISTNTVNVRIPRQVKDKLQKLAKSKMLSMGEMLETMVERATK